MAVARHSNCFISFYFFLAGNFCPRLDMNRRAVFRRSPNSGYKVFANRLRVQARMIIGNKHKFGDVKARSTSLTKPLDRN